MTRIQFEQKKSGELQWESHLSKEETSKSNVVMYERVIIKKPSNFFGNNMIGRRGNTLAGCVRTKLILLESSGSIKVMKV